MLPHQQLLARYGLAKWSSVLEVGALLVVTFLAFWLALPWQAAIMATLFAAIFLSPVVRLIRIQIQVAWVRRHTGTGAQAGTDEAAQPKGDAVCDEQPQAQYPVLIHPAQPRRDGW